MNFKTYDKRDGAPDAALQFKPLGEVLGLAWNAWRSRGCTGFSTLKPGAHERELAALVREATRKGEVILGAALSNYGVEIAVSAVALKR